jgi:hypothetical protein
MNIGIHRRETITYKGTILTRAAWVDELIWDIKMRAAARVPFSADCYICIHGFCGYAHFWCVIRVAGR